MSDLDAARSRLVLLFLSFLFSRFEIHWSVISFMNIFHRTLQQTNFIVLSNDKLKEVTDEIVGNKLRWIY